MGDEVKEAQPSFVYQPKRKVWDIKERVQFPELFRSTDSIHPSYTGFILPYDAVCRQRYHFMKQQHRKQFCKEVRRMEMLQSTALDGVRLHMVFCNCFSYPEPKKVVSPLTSKERLRLEDIMKQRKGFFC
ncbi:uncharacterized protein LOC124594549 [Schistocerca americana]|uniref:uncharacterized protein LOC124594549 n=1 Tax=Schistocerca americana TaxID=7009 RepID=UPI001F4F6740|nr:uncharacterized protein LOC124594549 [Schistocerca americana]XP_047106798.1 uncharacterized protein LOC124776000 [Schistocerca piceifrons]XP_049771963.1 uncharacterized protein LOC126152441 [Schistocerca cancellata]XP_049800155.1 uncharacterized protein LOC126235478 [Schistocerca nitens]XP_049947201.1 uncharacterized protein LOC126455493 [Schistocerca serialis cubense]